MKTRLFALAMLLSLSVAAVAPVASTPVAHAAVAAAPAATHSSGIILKTKFLLHMGLAYGAFHRWVWKPFKAHQLGLSHKGNTIKAGIALLFAYHEVKVALGFAKRDKGLSKLVAPLTALVASFQTVGNRLQNGNISAADVNKIGSIDGVVGNVNTVAKAGGLLIPDLNAPIPGLG